MGKCSTGHWRLKHRMETRVWVWPGSLFWGTGQVLTPVLIPLLLPMGWYWGDLQEKFLQRFPPQTANAFNSSSSHPSSISFSQTPTKWPFIQLPTINGSSRQHSCFPVAADCRGWARKGSTVLPLIDCCYHSCSRKTSKGRSCFPTQVSYSAQLCKRKQVWCFEQPLAIGSLIKAALKLLCHILTEEVNFKHMNSFTEVKTHTFKKSYSFTMDCLS